MKRPPRAAHHERSEARRVRLQEIRDYRDRLENTNDSVVSNEERVREMKRGYVKGGRGGGRHRRMGAFDGLGKGAFEGMLGSGFEWEGIGKGTGGVDLGDGAPSLA